jgi:hypothetical protein
VVLAAVVMGIVALTQPSVVPQPVLATYAVELWVAVVGVTIRSTTLSG